MRIIALIMMSVFMLASCEQVDELTQFDMDYETSFTIPGTIRVDVPIDLQTPEIKTNSQQVFSGNDTEKDLIEEILLNEMQLTIQNPSDGDFSFLSGFTLYMNAEGLEETKIAWKDSIPDNTGSELIMETTSDDLKDYIFKDQFSLRIESRTEEIIEQDHEIKVSTVFHVDAKVLGQ